MFSSIFFFNDTATTEIYTLSLHDALPILGRSDPSPAPTPPNPAPAWGCSFQRTFDGACAPFRDRKSTRLNSSHLVISYAVFCLKKKKNSIPMSWQGWHSLCPHTVCSPVLS